MADDQSARRITVRTLNGDTLRDVSAENIPEASSTVQNLLDLLGRSAFYSRIYESASTQLLDREDPLTWGSSYIIVCMSCPACTLCEFSCTRQAEQHELCAHVSEGHIHIWHDLRKRSNSTRCWTQGYVDGLGLNRELDEEGIFDEIKEIATEILGDASSFPERQHRLSILLEWENRSAKCGTVVRNAIAAARECSVVGVAGFGRSIDALPL